MADQQIFRENVSKVNKTIQKIFLFLCLLPLALYLGNKINAWNLPLSFLFLLQGILIAVCLSNYIIYRTSKFPNFSKYYGIFSLTSVIAFIAANGRVAIYVSYGFFPFLASLYYSKKCTRIASAYSWVAMVVSMYIRSRITMQCHPFTAEVLSKNEFFICYTIGFSIELYFAHMLSMMMTKQGHKTLASLIENIDSTNSLNISLAEKNMELEDTQNKIIKFISRILGSHDLFTGNHVLHTQTYVGIIARELQETGHYLADLTDEKIDMICNAALLHDIGKVHIPEGILNKDGKFTPQEFEIMKSHPEEGKKILEVLPPIREGKFNRVAENMCLYHHEKWNGTGYPKGLEGDKIPLCARIMAAADVLDALLSRRLYKDPMTIDEAMDIFTELKGIQFEPCISDAVLAKKDTIENCDKFFKEEEEKVNITELAWWKRYHEYINGQKT